jgi:hypothetical protein
MDEPQDLQMIDQAFDTFRAAGPIGEPLGADLVRRTVSHRRKARAVAAGALAAIVLAAPVTAYATGLIQTKHGPPMVGTSTEPSPSEVTTPTPAQSATPTQTPSAPDGRSTKDQLSHATLDFSGNPDPDGLCPSGKFTFKGTSTPYDLGPSRGEVLMKLDEVIDVDFDHDGALESVVSISCATQGASHVVLALDRDTSGKIVTVAPVVWAAEHQPIGTVFDIRADADGVVGVQVGDKSPCCDTTDEMVEHQWRGYAYDGQKFKQSTGPTKFTPPITPPDMTVTAPALTLGKAEGGIRHGSVTATVKNNGPAQAPGAIIKVTIGSYGGTALPGKVTVASERLHVEDAQPPGRQATVLDDRVPPEPVRQGREPAVHVLVLVGRLERHSDPGEQFVPDDRVLHGVRHHGGAAGSPDLRR